MTSSLEQIESEAKARHERHIDHPTHRPLSDGYELVGLLGEREFAKWVGGSVDLTPRPGGDKGVDMILNTKVGPFPVDVKTARKAFNLIVEVGKVKPKTIYVLAHLIEEAHIKLVGWEWGVRLLRSPKRDFGYGVINHYIPRSKLRNMIELLPD